MKTTIIIKPITSINSVVVYNKTEEEKKEEVAKLLEWCFEIEIIDEPETPKPESL